MKVCTVFEVEAVNEQGHITAGHIVEVSVVDDEHRHPDLDGPVQVGTRLYFVNPITVTVRPDR
jgi:hypothetical protein